MPDVCSQHEILLDQIIELSKEVHAVKTLLLRAVVAMTSIISTLVCTVAVI